MLIKDPIPRSDIFKMWEAFTKGGTLAERVPPHVSASWKRCAESRLDPLGMNISQVATGEEMTPLLALNSPLLEASRSTLGILEASLSPLSYAILLCDPEGNILYQSGAGEVLKYFQQARLIIGGNCSEKVLGTTAPGIVLIEKKPKVVLREQHYTAIYHWCCCAAAPIFDMDGHLKGCLDVTTSYKHAASIRLALGLTMTTVKSIQSNLHLQQFLDKMEEAKAILDCTSNLSANGLLIVDRVGRILHINQNTQKVLHKPVEELIGTHYGQILASEAIGHCLSEKKTTHGRMTFQHQGRDEKEHALHARPLHDKGGRFIGALLILEEEKRLWAASPKGGSIARYAFEDIIGNSRLITRAIHLAQRFASTDMPIILQGETGTGKEMFAQAIHNQSRRKNGPFVPVNCAAIPRELVESELFGYRKGAFTGACREGKKGKFEMADSGTLFLDEINSMSSGLQAKLLRALDGGEIVRLGDHEYKHINVRIIAASSLSLEDEVHKSGFRKDLFYRLNLVRIQLPSLRERMDDLETLVSYFLNKSAKKHHKKVCQIHPDVIKQFYSHDWPGNIREIENCIDFAMYLADGETILPEHLPDYLFACLHTENSETLKKMQKIEKSLLLQAIESAQGHIGEAARRLGISRSTIYRKRKQYGLIHPDEEFPKNR